MIRFAEGPTLAALRRSLARWSLEMLRGRLLIRYGFSVVCVAVALAVAAPAFQYYGFRGVVSTFFNMAIAVTGWYAGVGPSSLAVMPSAACFNYFFLEPLYSFHLSSENLPYFLVFTSQSGPVSSKRATANSSLLPIPSPTMDLNEILREMTVLLRDAADRHSISIRADLDPRLQRTHADRVQLQQVVVNLMLNAIEAMRETGGELTIASKTIEDGGLSVSVSDTGVGLPADAAGRIFDPFFTAKPQGTGMGLSICRRIIESHGGRLWAGPNAGKGAAFHFTLPVERPATSSRSLPDHVDDKTRGEAEGSHSG